MERLLEHEIFAAVLGEDVNLDLLEDISIFIGKGSESYADCDGYIIRQSDYCDELELARLFKITDAIKKRWTENNIDFFIFLFLKNSQIIGGHIFKFHNIDTTDLIQPSGYETDPTQQEIRIASRVLTYLIKSYT